MRLISFLCLLNTILAWKEYGQCLDETLAQSPIDLRPPFSHIDLEIEYEFLETKDIYLKNTGSEILVQGAYGFIRHNGRMFSGYLVKFKSPSEHSFDGNVYPLEMEIFFISPDKYRIGISVFFKVNKDHTENALLASFGFGKEIIKNLLQGDIYAVPSPLTLAEIFQPKEKFVIYSGSDTYPPCEQQIWLVLYRFQYMSTNQAIDFPEAILYQIREQQVNKRPIYANFDPAEFSVEPNDVDTKEQLQKQRSRHQIDKKLVRDNFRLLGGAQLSAFVFVPKGYQGGKVVRTEDYFVIKIKPEPKDPQSEPEQNNEQPEQDAEQADEQHNGELETDETHLEVQDENPDHEQIVDAEPTEANLEPAEQVPEEVPQQVKKPRPPKVDEPVQQEEPVKIDSHSKIKQVQASKSADAKQQAKDKKLEEFPEIVPEWPRLCHVGRAQSPINLDPHQLVKQPLRQPELGYDIVPTQVFLSFDGFQLKLLPDEAGFGILKWNGKLFQAHELNFHIPSEHTLGSSSFHMDAEIQIVHKSVEGEILVLAIFLQNTYAEDSCTFLEDIGLPSAKVVNYRAIQQGELIAINKQVALSKLISDLGDFLTYTGSLTTPPCIENVQYIIRRSRVPIGTTQLENMQKLLGSKSNARPTQNLNGRNVYTN